MLDAMDRAALSMITILDDDKKDDNGRPIWSLKEKMQVFDRGQQWLEKRKKVKPEETDQAEAQVLVERLKEYMGGPEFLVERYHDDPAFIAALQAKGWLAPVKRRPGRQKKADAEAQAVYDAEVQRRRADDDDSTLQRMLRADQ